MLDLDKITRTGVQLIDEDHRRIFTTLNRIEESLAQGWEPRTVMELLTALEDHSITHFQREERTMACLKCPLHGANCDAHRVFLERLDHWFITLSSPGASAGEARRIHDECSRWITAHVELIDSALKQAPGAEE